ncbi:MAG: Ig-like domain-containing protein [Gemmatimonadales bacterium]
MRRWLLLSFAAALLVGCRDAQRPIAEPSFAISDGSSGGNTEFFFYPPLAANPSGDPNFDAGAANPFLAPFAKICELALGADPTGGDATCVLDVTPPGNLGGLPLVFDAAGEFYKVNWHTSESNLDEATFYRIEVFAVPVTGLPTAQDRADFRYGFRDIDPATNVGSCTGEPFCKVNNGSNVALKVRIERFASCPDTRTCASQFIPANQAVNLTLPSTNELFVPAQGGTDFFVNFDLCSAAEEAAVDAAIDLPTFGPCFKTKTPFTGQLTTPAIISVCEPLDFIPPEYSHTQTDQIALHHFSTTGGTPTNPIGFVEALPEANRCLSPQASAPRGNLLRRFAQALGHRVLAFLTPRPLVASTVVVDFGAGGSTDGFFSFFKLALPGKFEYLIPADALQVAPAGSPKTIKARVTDLTGAGIRNARVHWKVVDSPSDAAAVTPVTVLTDANGVAAVTLMLDPQSGDNVVDATGKGIADARESGCPVPGVGMNASCNGPRATFDPFIPLNRAIDGMVGESSVRIAQNTRLPFTVCSQGFGTATINGFIGAAEWFCAFSEQFTANLPGGSTTPATVFWMNDGANLYVAVRVPQSAADQDNILRFDFDSDGDDAGVAEAGDDVLEFDVGTSVTRDRHLTAKCASSTQSFCGADDTSIGGGQNNIVAQFSNDGTFSYYELSHPLTGDGATLGATGPAIDFTRHAGQPLGWYLTLHLGKGTKGKTVYPGFRTYRAIAVQ